MNFAISALIDAGSNMQLPLLHVCQWLTASVGVMSAAPQCILHGGQGCCDPPVACGELPPLLPSVCGWICERRRNVQPASCHC